MSSPGVKNPIPKGTKTINDVFSSQESNNHKATKPLEMRRLSSKKISEGGQLNNSHASAYNDYSSGYETSKTQKKKGKSLSKQRTNNSMRRNIPRSGGAKVTIRTQGPPGDFDTETVNDGLDEIDLMLDQLERDVPDDLYEDADFEVDEMMKANRMLREKIGDIASMVITAIQKASKLKKQIVTHRDEPNDPSVASKNKEIKDYQAKITKCKNHIKTLNIRLESLRDADRLSGEENKLTILEAEIKELEKQRKVLAKNIKLQQTTMNNLYDDPEFREKVQQTKDDIQKLKENHNKMDEERKQLKSEQQRVLDEMTKLNNKKLKLRQKKIDLENGVKPSSTSKALDLQEEASILKNRNKVFENIKDKKQTNVKNKIVDKEKRLKQLEKEIEEARSELRDKTKENEKLSKESKQLKAMMPAKPIAENKDIEISGYGGYQQEMANHDKDDSFEDDNIRDNIEDNDSEQEYVKPKKTIGL